MNIGLLYGGEEKQIAGVNRVIYECVNEILRMDERNTYLSVQKNYLGFPIKDIHAVDDIFKTVKVLDAEEKVRAVSEYFDDMGLIHSYYSSFEDLQYKCGKILTVHDLIPLIHPEWFPSASYEYFDDKIRRTVQIADRVLTVSESTRKDVIEWYGADPDKVKVVYPGLYSTLDFEHADRKLIDKWRLEDGYILSVCTLEPRKNLRSLIKAYAQFKDEHPSVRLKLVLTGKLGWDDEFQSWLQSLGRAKEDIVMTGYVSDEELSALYKNAMAVAYVSYYEGFGLPILEAMAAGKAVICSNTSSMPEVGGDTAVYCDPYDIDSIADAISRVYYNEDMRNDLGQRARVRSDSFSYKKMAEETLGIYAEFE